MTDYSITNLGNQTQWVVSESGEFVDETASLALALAYLATVLQYGDTIVYVDEPPV